MTSTDDAAARVSRTIEDWCDAEFRPWTGSRLTYAEVRDRLRGQARRALAICLYRIDDGTVEFHPDMQPRSDFMDPTSVIGLRAHKYLDHLRDAVRIFGVRGTAPVGVFLADLYLDRLSAPVFFFQKPAGTRGLLIPDIDLLVQDYNLDRDGRFDDRIPFAGKEARAIFVGSTTGDSPLTRRLVEEGRNARIAAARFFRDRDEVVFELPNICQQDDDDTLALIRALGIGGPDRGWAEQQRYRYQLSIDGNGATCGRVAIALHSRSALLKYASPNRLYYFHGLEPWRHYVPIDSEGAVLDVIAEAEAFAPLHAAIAAESRTFAQTFLSRHAILKYTAHMLARYIARFGRGGGPLTTPHDAPLIECAVRLSDTHWHRGDPGEWSGTGDASVRAFALAPTGGIDWDGFDCRAVTADGSPTPIVHGGQSCGANDALHGVSVCSASHDVVVEERFADGHVRRSVSPPEPAFHAAPLTGLRLSLARD